MFVQVRELSSRKDRGFKFKLLLVQISQVGSGRERLPMAIRWTNYYLVGI